jgi:anti-sigma-K factor RskA
MGCPHRDDAGPWVLGALGGEDESAFRAHLEDCDACRDEVTRLQMVADVLPMAAPRVAAPPELKRRIMAVVESEARQSRAGDAEADRGVRRERVPVMRRLWPARLGRLRPVPVAVFAAVVLAVGVATGVLIHGGPDSATRPGFGPPGTQVALKVTGDHGELILRGMPAPPPGRVYQVWLVHGKDQPRPTHTLFTVPRDGRADVTIMEPLKGTDRVLVTDEPQGGSSHPTTQPVAGAVLS